MLSRGALSLKERTLKLRVTSCSLSVVYCGKYAGKDARTRDARDAYLETNKIIGFCLKRRWFKMKFKLLHQFETICLLNSACFEEYVRSTD